MALLIYRKNIAYRYHTISFCIEEHKCFLKFSNEIFTKRCFSRHVYGTENRNNESSLSLKFSDRILHIGNHVDITLFDDTYLTLSITTFHYLIYTLFFSNDKKHKRLSLTSLCASSCVVLFLDLKALLNDVLLVFMLILFP